MTRRKKIIRLILRIAGTVLTVALLAVCTFFLLLLQPQSDQKEAAASQPLLTAGPAVNIQQEAELRTLVETFPAPVMSFMSGSGMVFVSGTSADAALDGGFGRIATLYWQTAEGEPMILQSIYPASALSLLDATYHFSSIAGPTLFGSASVRMETADTVRIHAATASGLYVMIVPKSLASRISALSRSLQLFSIPRETDLPQ